MNGLEYWNNRWKSTLSPGEGSWEGDSCARALELEFIARRWPAGVRSVFELGCGGMSLLDLPRLNSLLLGTGYVGADGSQAAIDIARIRHPSGWYETVDFESQAFSVADYASRDLFLSRRVLQNLSRSAREKTIASLHRFKHGILLEGTTSGLSSINALRKLSGHEPLKTPPFNDYLSSEEEAGILAIPGCVRWTPLSTYYAITRGVLNERNNQAAFELALRQPEIGGFGTHVGFTWSQE